MSFAPFGGHQAALGRENPLIEPSEFPGPPHGSDLGGERAAAMYSILQTAKLNGLNPEAYLRNTLHKIANAHPISQIDQLMPWQLPTPP
jgi:hypothetical protein